MRSSIKHSLGQYNISPVLDFERNKNLMFYGFEQDSRGGSLGIEINSNYNPFEKNKTISAIDVNNNFEEDTQILKFSSDSENLTQLDFKDISNSGE